MNHLTYTEIMKALPREVVLSLQKNFDLFELSENPTLDEARLLIFEAVKLTQAEVVIEDEVLRKMVDMLLSFLPNAGADAVVA